MRTEQEHRYNKYCKSFMVLSAWVITAVLALAGWSTAPVGLGQPPWWPTMLELVSLRLASAKSRSLRGAKARALGALGALLRADDSQITKRAARKLAATEFAVASKGPRARGPRGASSARPGGMSAAGVPPEGAIV
jgi:hypothetical protein